MTANDLSNVGFSIKRSPGDADPWPPERAEPALGPLLLQSLRHFGPRRHAEARKAFEALNGSVCFDELYKVPRGTRSETHTYDLNANGFVAIQIDACFESSLGQTVHWPTERAYFALWSRTMIRGDEWRVGEDDRDSRIRKMVLSSSRLV